MRSRERMAPLDPQENARGSAPRPRHCERAARRAAVLAVALGILLFSNAVAKEADVPVNMLFSRNVKFAKMGQLEVVKADKIS